MMVLGDGQAQTESQRVNQYDYFKKICDDEANQSALIKTLAKQYDSASRG